MSTVALHTLGCKVNQYETERIAEDFLARGFEVVEFSASADVYVINTCTVTQTADSKSRQAVRAAIKRNPDAVVVMTGCYAETRPEEARQMKDVALIIGNRDKALLADKVARILPPNGSKAPIDHDESHSSTRGRTRALLKVQDGCDQFCSYCAVPLARPVLSSKPCDEVIEEAQQLSARGFREIVLAGIRLGRYRDGDVGLIALIERLDALHGIERIRLSSIELTDIEPGLVDLMAGSRKLCRHLHLPLQSGDDGVLKRMNRPYRTAEFEAFVAEAREKVPEIAITTDIMVGFPGETNQEYETSYSFAERMRFSRMHVFRFSPRPGTPAADMPDAVPDADKEERSRRLIDLGRRCAREFATGIIGKTVPVIAESKEIDVSLRSGLTDNYVRIKFECPADRVGRMVDVRVDSISDNLLSGEIIE